MIKKKVTEAPTAGRGRRQEPMVTLGSDTPEVVIPANENRPALQADPNAEPGVYVALRFQLDQASGMLDVGVVQVPIDLRIIRQMQTQLGDQMAAANMKLEVVGTQVFLSPIKKSSLILPG